MDDETKAEFAALKLLISAQDRANDLLLQRFLEAYLSTKPPEFAEVFLDLLYQTQSDFPSPDRSDPFHSTPDREILLRFWKRKVALAEKAVATVTAERKRTS